MTLSKRFVQEGSTVVDVGCSTGGLLSGIERHNSARRDVSYIGLDIESKFGDQWAALRRLNLNFEVADVRNFPGLLDMSYATSMFTLQFIPEPDKLAVVERIYKGLRPGGALLIAEKALASTARLQDALTFPYYDFKRKHFRPDEILDKERSLRGQMTLWSEEDCVRISPT